MKCEQCNKTKAPIEFAPTTSAFFPTQRINICFDCVAANVDGGDLNQVDRFLQHCNITFLPDEWRKIWTRTPNEAFKKYTNTYYDMKYLKQDWNSQNKKLIEIAKEGLLDAQLEELKPALMNELRLEWGDLDDLTLMRLERYYNRSTGDYNVETQIERDLLRKISRLSIIIDNDLQNGQVEKDSIQQYDKLVSLAMKTLSAARGEGITSIGQIIAFMELNGYQPKFYDGIPKDEIDLIMKNMQEYTRDLVLGELDLAGLYEKEKFVQEKKKESEDE